MMEEQPQAYRCKHECERDALKNTIHQLGENAAKAAAEYAERVAVLEGHLGKLVNFIGRLPATLPTPEEQDAFEAAREVCWEVETRAALTEPTDEG